MKPILILTLMTIFVSACQNNTANTSTGESSKTDTAKTDTAKKNYLPVNEYLKSEIALVDSFPYRIMRYHTVNGKMDSSIITTAVFNEIARQFLKADLDSSVFEHKFEENSFVDRSTDLISFTYSTKDTGYGLKRVDVLLTPGAGNSKLSSIYMEGISGKPDSTVISKWSWKAGKNFRIIRILPGNKGKETTDQVFVDWDNRD